MPTAAGTLETLAQQLALALQPLKDRLASGNVLDLFAELGLQFPANLLAPSFTNALNSGVTAASALPALITDLTNAITAGDDAGILQAGENLIEQISKLVTAFGTISTEMKSLAGSLPGMITSEVNDFADKLPAALLSYALISYLRQVQPGVLGIGNLVGITEYIPTDGVPGDPTHPPFTARNLNLSRISALFKSPADLLNTLFQWGDPAFDGTELFPLLATTLGLLGLPVTSLGSSATPELDVSLLSLVANPATSPPGLLATLTYPIPTGVDLTVPVSNTLSFRVQAQGTFVPGLTIIITPPASVTFHPSAALNGLLQFNFIAKPADPNQPIILIGQTGSSRLQTESFTFGMGMTITWNSDTGQADADPMVQAAVTGGLVVIDMSDADGFLADVLSGVNVQAGFDFAATWRADTGLHVTGGAQLEIDLPLHLDLGPVTLPILYLIGGMANDAITLELSVALGLTLGPFEISVDRVGMLGTVTFPQQGGNLGPANLQLGFKPPNGLGIALDAGLVTGGGYISFDASKGQYAGILQLSLVDTIGITVIGVLDTIMPDGSSGYSFVLVITFTLPPIQLGFGFTLNGVGGLGGVNRTMNTDALQAGFRAHTLGAIMFPPDPIDNAPQIISDIRNFFPIAEGRYLFGPLLELGWGTPTLITLTLGVLLEVPDPIRIAILGLIDAGLPTEDDALLVLHIEVLGIIDFGAKTLSIDGTLFDSSVLVYALAGDLALRVSWGSNPNFLFSLGGFNPNFNTDGLDVPKLARLSVSLGSGSNPRISADSYFAVTSNSVQFGANVQAYAAAGGFSIQGYLGYDVLIIISPFSFEFDFSASFDVAYDGHTLLGLNVNGTFQGPTPWHFHGEASISLLFFSVSASVDLTWGSSTQATIPAQPVLPDLFNAFKNPQSWSAALPPATTVGVSLATQKPTDQTLCVHPIGTLQVKETVVPLDLPITKYGNATPSDGTEFSIQSVQINAQTETIQTIQDYFAPGQFLNLSDADKLSKPSFEEMDAGVNIGSSAILNGQDSPRTVVYQEFYIYDPANFSIPTGPYLMPANIHLALSAQGAGFASQVKNTGLQKYSVGPTPPAIVVDEPQYVVTSVLDLSVRADILAGTGSSYFQAQAALSSYLAANPAETGDLQIMPMHEVAA
jgi:hypothetical protein